MKPVQTILLAACAVCLSNVAFAQTSPNSAAPTGSVTENGTVTIPRPLSKSGTDINDPRQIAVDGTMGNSGNTMSGRSATKGRRSGMHTHKEKHSEMDGGAKVKTKM